MRVGGDGATATLVNALTGRRALGLSADHAQAVAVAVAGVVPGWRAHIGRRGVSAQDVAALSRQIDRDVLAQQGQHLLP